jgi:hypothetical protein
MTIWPSSLFSILLLGHAIDNKELESIATVGEYELLSESHQLSQLRLAGAWIRFSERPE